MTADYYHLNYDEHPEYLKHERMEDDLNKALDLVRELVPGAVSITLQSSDQQVGYGFWLSAITLPAGDLPEPELRFVADVVDDYLIDLNWDGPVGEDKTGLAVIRLASERAA